MPIRTPWLKTWALSLVLTAGALGFLEGQFRAAGFGPSIHDSPDLWWTQYRRIEPCDQNAVVIAGSSRSQLAIDPATLQRSLAASSVTQLAINGSSPMLVLEQLASDPGFCGTLLFEVQPIVFDARSAGDATPAAVLAQRETAVWRPLETHLRAAVQSAFVFRNPLWDPKLFPRLLRPATWHGLFYIRTAFDRSVKADYRTDRDVGQEERWAQVIELMQPMTLEQRDDVILRICRACDNIKRRGGDVVLIYFPGSGLTLEAEERRFPRDVYWDRLAAASQSSSLHLLDVAEVAEVYRPCDGSHLDGRQTATFTAALAESPARLKKRSS